MIGLFSGSIPIVAIQLNALKVSDRVVLDFVKVLDQRQLREDDTVDAGGAAEPDVDRSAWESRMGATLMKVCDRIKSPTKSRIRNLELKYKKGRVALSAPDSFFNVLALSPKKNFVHIRFRVTDPESWVKRLSEAGVEAELKDGTLVLVRLRNATWISTKIFFAK